MPTPPYEINYGGRTYRQSIIPTGTRFTKRVSYLWEMDTWSGDIWRSNLPDVFRCGDVEDNSNGHYVKLNREWQFFWFDICSKAYYGRYHEQLTRDEYDWLASKWTALGSNYRAFTNNHGLDVFANFVTGKRLDQELPAIYTLWCGGASTKELKIVRNSDGIDMVQVPAFDGTKAPPDVRTIDIKNDPRIFCATSVTSTKDGEGGYHINPFPMFEKNGTPQDALVPLIANKPIYYPKKYFQDWKSNVKFNPYNPDKPIFQNYP